jgi:hypothetical protein
MPRRSTVIGFTAIGAASASAFGEQIAMSWQATDMQTANDGDTETREGTATFANGEKAHIVSKLAHGSGVSWSFGTYSSVTTVYKFADGSGFTLRSVGFWNSIIIRFAGLFSEGNGRFAGITGGATGGGETLAPSSPWTISWAGTYELPKR